MTAASVGPPMSFWGRAEAWLLALQKDGERQARYLQVGYWISLAFVGIGLLVALLALAGAWRP
jgi:hypothetical protein